MYRKVEGKKYTDRHYCACDCVSACLGLSIRQAAESAKQSALDELTVTATISYDRSSMMNNMMGGGKGQSEGKFDKDQFSSMMGSASALTLEEYQKYAEAESVQDFNYTLTAYFNGTDTFLHVSDEIEETDSSSDFDSLDGSSQGGMEIPGGRGDKGGMMSSLQYRRPLRLSVTARQFDDRIYERYSFHSGRWYDVRGRNK